MNKRIKSIMFTYIFCLIVLIAIYAIYLIGAVFVAFVEWRPLTEFIEFSIPIFDDKEKRGLLLALALITFIGSFMKVNDD